VLLTLTGLIFIQPAFSQSKKEKRKARKELKIQQGKPLVTPLAGPAYTPELGFTLAGGIMISYKTKP
jgi:small neutral amino acid transporter SnatA (MarC family)